MPHRAHLDVLAWQLVIGGRAHAELGSLGRASRTSIAIWIIIREASQARIGHTTICNRVTLEARSACHPTHRVEALAHGRPTLVIADARQHRIHSLCRSLGPFIHPRLSSHLHRFMPVEASVGAAHAAGQRQATPLLTDNAIVMTCHSYNYANNI